MGYVCGSQSFAGQIFSLCSYIWDILRTKRWLGSVSPISCWLRFLPSPWMVWNVVFPDFCLWFMIIGFHEPECVWHLVPFLGEHGWQWVLCLHTNANIFFASLLISSFLLFPPLNGVPRKGSQAPACIWWWAPPISCLWPCAVTILIPCTSSLCSSPYIACLGKGWVGAMGRHLALEKVHVLMKKKSTWGYQQQS